MYFVGVDLAWAGRNPTGVAAVDADGCLVGVGAARDDASVLAALRPYVVGDCLVAFDAPLVVANRTGQRPAEAALNRDFRQFEAGAYPANTEKPEFADVPRAARLARQLALDMDPLSSATRRAIEVYPHPATVALFRLPRALKYKAKPGRSVDLLKSELLRLMDGVEGLAQAGVRMQVAGQPDWVSLRRQVTVAQRKSDLRAAEDPIDAVVCAYVALYAQRRPADVTIYGDFTTHAVAAHRLQNGTGRWSTGASTSMRSTTVASAAARGSRPSTSAETTDPSTAQINVHTSSICAERPERSMASATASAR